MGRFSAPLTVTKIDNDVWMVETHFTYFTTSGREIIVPRGFITDFASVPWGVRNFFPKDYDGTQAAVLHDYLYSKRFKHGITRKECDDIFLEAMKVLNVGWLRRQVMHKAVRSAGWAYWNKNS